MDYLNKKKQLSCHVKKRDEGVLLINQDIYKIFIKNEQNFFFKLFFIGRFIFPLGERRRGVGERRRWVGERRIPEVDLEGACGECALTPPPLKIRKAYVIQR